MEFKTCRKCNGDKFVTEFHKSAGYKFGVSSICKTCKKSYDKSLNKHPDYTSRRRMLKRFVDSKKLSPCTDCGKTYEPECMEFDHLHSKIDGLARLVHSCCSIKTITLEIEKTELVCLSCHRNRTYSQVLRNGKDTAHRRIIKRNEKFINELKKQPCSICNKTYNPWQMDFDHINPDSKKFTISKMIKTSFSLNSILLEIAKCSLLCAVCHRRKTLLSR